MPARPRSVSSERQRNVRGNSRDRAARRAWLLLTFDTDLGPEQARCKLALTDQCLGVVDATTLSVDRITPGGSYTRGNIQPACGPCQNHQGGQIGPSRQRRSTTA